MKQTILLFLVLVKLNVFSQESTTIAGDYKGAIEIPGSKLNVVIHITEDDRKLSATLDVPQQNNFGMRITEVKYVKGEITGMIPDVPGNCSFTAKYNSSNDSLNGIFSQGGMILPLKTKKVNDVDTKKETESLEQKIKIIEAYADSLLIKGEIVGMSIGIYKDGKILLNKGFGYSDLENKIKADENTLFAIGSCSKAFTTAVLATLNDEGVFDWEKPVKSYIPYFGMHDKFADEQANAIDLCSHRTGLPRHDLIWYGSTLTRKQLVEKIKFMEPNKSFRTDWQYNNFMFLTAGVIAEEITKDNWENLVQKRIFDPLDMKSSKNHFDDFNSTSNKSKGYSVKDDKPLLMPYRNIDPMGPAGSIFSSSTDMLKWTKLLLDGGKLGDKTIISTAQVEFLLSPKMLMPQEGKTFKGLTYGLGWMIAQYADKKIITHGGNIDGFTANVTLFPEDNLSIVMLINKNETSIAELFSLYVSDKLNDRKNYDWYEETIGKPKKAAKLKAEEAKKAEEEEKKKNAKNKTTKPEAKKGPLHDLKDYAGEYYNDAYGTCTVELINKELFSKINTFELKMKHDQYETFLGTFLDESMKINFFTNEAGKVEWLQTTLEPSVDPIKFIRKIPDYLNNAAYLEKICGEYDFNDLQLTIVKDGKKLMSKLSDGQHYPLIPSGDNTFKLDGIEGFNMEFVFDEKGNCAKVTSHQPNGDFDAKRKK